MGEIRTVLGNIDEAELGVTLPHEHIFCYSEYLYRMAGSGYLDKEAVFRCAAEHLAMLRRKHHLSAFVDCTPVNIGRDVPFLRRLSRQTGIHMVCSTGFYHTEELLLRKPGAEDLCEFMCTDAQNTNAGILKCAVDEKTELAQKLLRATAMAQLRLGLPIVAHTNGRTENGLWALDILLSQGVSPRAVTVAHLSDSDNLDYVKSVAAHGCYVGLDRHYEKKPEGYAEEKIRIIRALCEAGYGDRLLLSHDALFYSGFSSPMYTLNPKPRFYYIFEQILPRFLEEQVRKFTVDNPRNMLLCR